MVTSALRFARCGGGFGSARHSVASRHSSSCSCSSASGGHWFEPGSAHLLQSSAPAGRSRWPAVRAAAIGVVVAVLILLAWLGREGDTRDARAGIGVVLVLAAIAGMSVLFRRERHHGSSPGGAI